MPVAKFAAGMRTMARVNRTRILLSIVLHIIATEATTGIKH
jgi:hypothetical protein